METPTTTLQHHHLSSPVSSMGIERMGVNPKHPEYSSSSDNNDERNPIHIMEHSVYVMKEWNTTIVPHVQSQIHTLVQRVKEIKQHEDDRKNGKIIVGWDQNDSETMKQRGIRINTELGIIFKQTIGFEQQVRHLYEQLRQCKTNIRNAVQINPTTAQSTKTYLSAISKLPIFGKVTCQSHDQITLNHYYEHEFLHQYETATIECHSVMEQCQHLILLISTTRI